MSKREFPFHLKYFFPLAHRTSPPPQSPDDPSVIKWHPASHCTDHGERRLLGLWCLYLGGCNNEAVRLKPSERLSEVVSLRKDGLGWLFSFFLLSYWILLQASDLLGPEDFLSFWSLWVPKLPWSHFALLVTSDWS